MRWARVSPPDGPSRAVPPGAQLWAGAAVTLGPLFGGFESGFATVTEISAFAALYALVAGGIAFRQRGAATTARSFVHAATRSGLVLFILAAAEALAFVLTLRQIPRLLGDALIALPQPSGTWLFMLLSIAMLVGMGSVLEGAGADVIATLHVAGLTPSALEHQALDTVEQVRALVAGEMPEGGANAQTATRLGRLRAPT